MHILGILLKIIVGVLIIIGLVILIAIIVINNYPGIGKMPDENERKKFAKLNEYYYDNQFHNIEDTITMTGESRSEAGNKTTPDVEIPVTKWTSYEMDEKFSFNWLGHSSLLIQMNSNNILIDPVLTTYSSPFDFIGIKRFSGVAIEPENIPDIDILIISHDHYDHLDYQTIKVIDSKVKKYIVPLGVDSIIKSWGVEEDKINVVNWWDELEINNIKFICTPSRHFSTRNPLHPNSTLWAGFYFTDGNTKVYYTSDGGYSKTFKEINEKCGEVDIIFPDSGQYNKAWSAIHMNPTQAVQSAKDVNAKYCVPVHWGAFRLSNHNWNDPAIISTEAGKEKNVKIITPEIGQKVFYDEIENYTNHWWN